MAEQRQDDQQEPTYSSSVPIRDVTLKTSRKQWTIERGGKRWSRISVLIARRDDIYIHIYIYIYVCVCVCVCVCVFFRMVAQDWVLSIDQIELFDI